MVSDNRSNHISVPTSEKVRPSGARRPDVLTILRDLVAATDAHANTLASQLFAYREEATRFVVVSGDHTIEHVDHTGTRCKTHTRPSSCAISCIHSWSLSKPNCCNPSAACLTNSTSC